jgi:hypothetical protein
MQVAGAVGEEESDSLRSTHVVGHHTNLGDDADRHDLSLSLSFNQQHTLFPILLLAPQSEVCLLFALYKH